MPSPNLSLLSSTSNIQWCHSREKSEPLPDAKDNISDSKGGTTAHQISQSQSSSSTDGATARRSPRSLRTSVLISQTCQEELEQTILTTHEREDSRSSAGSGSTAHTSNSSIEIISVTEDLSVFLSGRRSITPAAVDSRENSMLSSEFDPRENEEREVSPVKGMLPRITVIIAHLDSIEDMTRSSHSDVEAATSPSSADAPSQPQSLASSSVSAPSSSDSFNAENDNTDVISSAETLNAHSRNTVTNTVTNGSHSHTDDASRHNDYPQDTALDSRPSPSQIRISTLEPRTSPDSVHPNFAASDIFMPTSGASKSPNSGIVYHTSNNISHKSSSSVVSAASTEGVTPNVYINGLPPHFPDESLYLMTKEFGNVVSVRTFTRHVGDRLSGYGFVLFEKTDDAERCIESLKKYRNLHPSFSKQLHKIPGTAYSSSSLSSLPTHPSMSSISTDMSSSSWRTPASFPSSSTMATSASIHAQAQLDFAQKSEQVSETVGRAESFKAKMERLKDEKSTNLYIEGLPLSIDERSLGALMAPHRMMSNRFFQTRLSDPPRMIAFVRLETRYGAEEVIERLHGRVVRGWEDNGSRISVRFADTAEQRELRRNERLARGEDDDPAAATRLSMAQAALLNIRGVQMQSQARRTQSAYSRGPQGAEFSTSLPHDIPLVISSHGHQAVVQPQTFKPRVHAVANGVGGGLLGGSRSAGFDGFGRALPQHPLTAALNGLSLGSVDDRGADAAPVMYFQKFLDNPTAKPNPSRHTEDHSVDPARTLAGPSMGASLNYSGAVRSVQDMPTPLSPLQLQHAANHIGDGGRLCDLSIAEQLAILQQQQMKIQQQQQEVAAKLSAQMRSPSIGSDGFAMMKAHAMMRSPNVESKNAIPPSLDAFARLRERVLAQQQQDKYSYQQQQYKQQDPSHSQQLQDQVNQQTHEQVGDVGVIGMSPSTSPSLGSAGRLGQSQRLGDLRQHILVHNQQNAMSHGHLKSSGDQMASDRRDDRPNQQQHGFPKHSRAFNSLHSPEQHHLSVRSRRIEDEEGSGSDATPFVSPALTYASRTPSTLSPSTPLFETFTPPQQTSASIPGSGSSMLSVHQHHHHGSANQQQQSNVKATVDGVGHTGLAAVAVSSPGQTSSPNTGAHTRRPVDAGQH